MADETARVQRYYDLSPPYRVHRLIGPAIALIDGYGNIDMSSLQIDGGFRRTIYQRGPPSYGGRSHYEYSREEGDVPLEHVRKYLAHFAPWPAQLPSLAAQSEAQ